LNYQRYHDGPAFIVRWRHPTVEASDRLGVEMEQYHERVGEPLFMGVIVGPDCPAPDPATREALLRGHDRIYDCCLCIRMVFIGGSLRQTMMRSVVTGITIATGLRGKGIAVDRSVAAMARTAQQMLGMNPVEVLRRLESCGMLDANEMTASEAELRR
jgi:hypothetical protein